MASPRWAYAAAVWALLFALASFYWALGGQSGMGTIAANPDDIDLITEPMVVFLSGAAKILAGLLALAGARARGGPRLVCWLRNLTLVGGVFMLLNGIALLVQQFLMVAGAVNTPKSPGEQASRWHLELWDPFWIGGGVLFLATGRSRNR